MFLYRGVQVHHGLLCVVDPFILSISKGTNFWREDKAGDKICLFGFSRGAYTARALAGMIKKVRLAFNFFRETCLIYHV